LKKFVATVVLALALVAQAIAQIVPASLEVVDSLNARIGSLINITTRSPFNASAILGVSTLIDGHPVVLNVSSQGSYSLSSGDRFVLFESADCTGQGYAVREVMSAFGGFDIQALVGKAAPVFYYSSGQSDQLVTARSFLESGSDSCSTNVDGSASTLTPVIKIRTLTFVPPFKIQPSVSVTGATDIDGNGQAEPLTDGLMLIRYMFGMRGVPLIAGAVGEGATRTTAGQIEAHIRSVMP